jgi:hypothetical protein
MWVVTELERAWRTVSSYHCATGGSCARPVHQHNSMGHDHRIDFVIGCALLIFALSLSLLHDPACPLDLVLLGINQK